MSSRQVSAASQATPDEGAARAFFKTSTTNLHEVGHAAGVERMIVLSIIGTEKFDSGFVGAVNDHEAAAKAGPIPTDIVRASQFHEFLPLVIEWATQDGVAHLPKMRTQPVATRALAEVIADLQRAAYAISDATSLKFFSHAVPRSMLQMASWQEAT